MGQLRILAGVTFILMLCGVVVADEAPPFGADPISLTRTSPSVVGFGNSPADIYGEVSIGLPVGMGWDVGGPGPLLHVKDATYGLTPADNNDAHSNGEVNAQGLFVIYFSGEAGSVGIPGTHYAHQSARLQAAGDRFVSNGFAVASPAAVMAGAGVTTIAGPVIPGPANLLSANQHRYNEIPSIMPPAFNAFPPPPGATVMDDMDALELTPFDVTGDLIHDRPIFFSLDPASPALPGSPADIFVSPPGAPGFGLYAAAPTMGLGAGDDIDALAVWDSVADLVASGIPLTDFALFSLLPGSPYLAGLDGVFGTADDFSPADIFVTDFSGASTLFLPSVSLGMLPSDNIDALDVELWLGPQSVEVWDDIPEPATLSLLALGALGLIRRRR